MFCSTDACARKFGLGLEQPKWFVEGMAYALSEDPRHPLNEPFESWRAQFLAWYAQVGREQLWQEARKL